MPCRETEFDVYVLECGHSQRIKKANYRAGKFRCRTCIHEKHTSEAKDKGLELLESISSNKRYRFIACGHEVTLSPDHVRTTNPVCRVCEESKNLDGLKKTCENTGASVVDDTGRYLRIKMSCGHEKSIKRKAFGMGKLFCRDCSEDTHNEQALSQGLRILSRDASNKNTTSYFYELPCGCSKSLRAGNVNLGKWSCDSHSAFYSREAYIYVVRLNLPDSKACLKVGVATNPDRRIGEYGKLVKSEMLKCWSFKSLASATKVEKKFHRSLIEFRIQPSDLSGIMKSGFTECYPENMGKLLIGILEGLCQKKE